MTQEWIAQIENALRQATPLAFASKEAMRSVTDQIVSFQQQNGCLPDELTIITQFAAPIENQLLRETQSASIAARKRARLDELSGANREEAVAELRRLRNPGPARKAFVGEDLGLLSQNEYDRLSDAEIKRRQFGLESLDINKEGSKLDISAPKDELAEYHRDKILRYKGRDPVLRALKRDLLDGAERSDIEYRRRVLEQQKEDRRKALADLKAGKK